MADVEGSPLKGFKARDLVDESNANGKSPHEALDCVEKRHASESPKDNNGITAVVFKDDAEAQFVKRHIQADTKKGLAVLVNGKTAVDKNDFTPNHFFLRKGRLNYNNKEKHINSLAEQSPVSMVFTTNSFNNHAPGEDSAPAHGSKTSGGSDKMVTIFKAYLASLNETTIVEQRHIDCAKGTTRPPVENKTTGFKRVRPMRLHAAQLNMAQSGSVLIPTEILRMPGSVLGSRAY
jgi:hypothetical protein